MPRREPRRGCRRPSAAAATRPPARRAARGGPDHGRPGPARGALLREQRGEHEYRNGDVDPEPEPGRSLGEQRPVVELAMKCMRSRCSSVAPRVSATNARMVNTGSLLCAHTGSRSDRTTSTKPAAYPAPRKAAVNGGSIVQANTACVLGEHEQRDHGERGQRAERQQQRAHGELHRADAIGLEGEESALTRAPARRPPASSRWAHRSTGPQECHGLLTAAPAPCGRWSPLTTPWRQRSPPDRPGTWGRAGSAAVPGGAAWCRGQSSSNADRIFGEICPAGGDDTDRSH